MIYEDPTTYQTLVGMPVALRCCKMFGVRLGFSTNITWLVLGKDCDWGSNKYISYATYVAYMP